MPHMPKSSCQRMEEEKKGDRKMRVIEVQTYGRIEIPEEWDEPRIKEYIKALKDIWPKTQDVQPEKVSGRSAKARPESAAREGGGKPKATTASVAEPETVKGMIHHFTEKMTKGDAKRPSAPFLSVLLKTENGDRWYSIFKRDLIDHVGKAKGKT